MTTFATYLLESNHFIREGLKSTLAKTDFHITAAPDHEDHLEALRHSDINIDLVIYGLEHPAALSPVIETLKSLHPQSKLVVMGFNTEPQFITACFQNGADGYLTKNTTPCALLNALNMIMSGEKIYPVVALNSLISMNKKEKQVTEYNLSAREQEILRHLALGETNKEIALEQNIAESTVKAHIKTILRKLSLTNRTQAARWAWNEGMINEAPPPSNQYYKQTQSMM